MIRIFLKLFFLFLGGYILYLIYKFLTEPLKREDRSKNTSEVIKGELVKDPVCGVYLPKEQAIKLEYNGETFYFCSQECKTKFLKESSK